jgi:hypothetical protein
MKIISSYKEYYDYLKGIYGEDPLLVLDRRITPVVKLQDISDGFIILTIGDYDFYGYMYKGKFMIDPDLPKELQKTTSIGISSLIKGYIRKGIFVKNLGDKAITWVEDCPIVLRYGNFTTEFPILTGSGLEALLPPEKIYQILVDWLSKRNQKKEKEVPVGDDKVRIQSKGFDLKTSFRPKTKKK